MEASGAGLAAGGEAQAQGSQGEAGEGVPPSGDGQATGDAAIAQMAEQLQQMQQTLGEGADTQEQMRQFLAAQMEQQDQAQQQQIQQQQEPDLGFLEQEADPQVAAQRLQQEIDRVAQARVQELLAPMQQQVSDMRLEQESDALLGEFPELGKEEVAAQLLDATQRQAEAMGRPELGTDLKFMRTVYLAGRAMQLAQEQGQGAASAPGVATLEGSGGAGAAGTQQGDVSSQMSDQIAENWSQRRSVLPKF